MKHFIDLFTETGFNFETSQCVRLASSEYIGENDVVGDFMNQYYISTCSQTDKVPLKDV